MTTGEGAVVADKSEISAIGHRVVQGAEFFTKSEIVTDAIIDKIEEIAPLAPVHNMAHVQGLRSAKKVFGADVPNVVVFDTTFHQTMPQMCIRDSMDIEKNPGNYMKVDVVMD